MIVNGAMKCYFGVSHSFTELVLQVIFNRDKIQDSSLTPYNVTNNPI